MSEIDFFELGLSALLTICGFAAHLLKSMQQVSANGWDKSVRDYLRAYPKQTAIAFLGTIGAIAALEQADQINYATLFMAGYMGNSLADIFAGRVTKSLR